MTPSGEAKVFMTGTLANIIKVIKSKRKKWAEHVAHMEKIRNAYKILVGKPEGRRPLVSSRCRSEDNIRMDVRGIEWEGLV